MRYLFAALATLLLLAALLPGLAAAQSPEIAGLVLDAGTRRPLGFVSVGVLRHPLGTVADARGRFALTLPTTYDADSVRLSLLGYQPRTLAVAALRRAVAAGPVLLQAQPVPLRPVRVQAPGMKRRVVGSPGKMMLQDYTYNTAGNQVAQLVPVRRPAFLQEMSFKVTHCSYDTVYFRLNVYRVQGGFPAGEVLPRPVYLKVSQEQTAERLYVNLRPYKLWLTEDVVVSLELVRSLGPGTLMLQANWPGGGPSYELQQTPGPLDVLNTIPRGMTEAPVKAEKQPDHGPWVRYPGVGMGFEAVLLEMPE